ncbi:MAG: hypothetical protein NZ942_00050 [Candidatus Aenigmarchaeota archaeon]|nr:hypothetical protein [Candidatus Aenigmarchaeota archaeon]
MSQLIQDGRKSQEKYGIIFRADEKSLIFPFSLSQEEMEELEKEIKNFYDVEKDFIGLKVKTERGKVYFSQRLYGFERRFAIDAFIYGCAIDDFKKIADTTIQKTIVGEKLFGYWTKKAGKKEAEKRLKEITKS